MISPIATQLIGSGIISATPPKEDKGSISPSEILEKYGLPRKLFSHAEKAGGEYFKTSKKLVIIVTETHNVPNPIKELFEFHVNQYQFLKALLNENVTLLLLEGRFKGKISEDVCAGFPTAEDILPRAISEGISSYVVFACVHPDKVETYGFNDADLGLRHIALMGALYDAYDLSSPKLKLSDDYRLYRKNLRGIKQNPEYYKKFLRFKEEASKKHFKRSRNKVYINQDAFDAADKRLTNLRSIKGVRNALEIMDETKENKAIMITGLAHKNLTIKTLKDKNVSYIMIQLKGVETLKKIYPLYFESHY